MDDQDGKQTSPIPFIHLLIPFHGIKSVSPRVEKLRGSHPLKILVAGRSSYFNSPLAKFLDEIMTGGQALLFIHCAGRLIINNSPYGVAPTLDSLRWRHILFTFSKCICPFGLAGRCTLTKGVNRSLALLRRRKQMTNLSRWGVFNFSTARAVSHLFGFTLNEQNYFLASQK
tara:strand:+ start:6508 stop:7023 length:516 start_codon:yes stop_codon:yes gene_type:complete